ncbi:MAG: hypothetical protein M3461_14665 [Pseudomonadota bacterium]|nr:hypothetical protein [Pseudomonadota bacterium]
MRTIVILTVMAITTALLAYNFMREDTAAEQPQVTSQRGATPAVDVRGRLDELASALRRFEQTNQEQLQRAEQQQTGLKRGLADLDTRLRSVEARAGEQITHAVTSDSAEQGTDTAVPNSGAGKAESAEISEADFGHWVDETLRVGYFDRDATELATEQAGKSVAKVPGVKLEDMQCGERLCRATFAHENGELPAIQDLLGQPPFVTDGFTINEAGARVSLYFARPGESLEELRNEARNAAKLGS